MTDREKAIVMAYTGICMLTGDKFQIYHKYVEDIMGRPVWTHEMAFDSIADEIRAKSKDDFIALCVDESSSENPNKWISVESALPEVVGEHEIRCSEDLLVYDGADLRVGYFVRIEKLNRSYWNIYGDDCFEPIAWMPLPEPYKAESEETDG